MLNYNGALGVKNGYTSKARFTLIAAAERDGRTVLVTLMKTSNAAWQEAGALSDWAFAVAAKARPVGALIEPLPEAQPAAVAQAAGQDVRASAADAARASARPAAGSAARSLLSSLGALGAFLAIVILGMRTRVLLTARERRTPVDVHAYLPAPRADEGTSRSSRRGRPVGHPPGQAAIMPCGSRTYLRAAPRSKSR